MWSDLVLSVVFVLAILYVPACLIVRLWSKCWLKSIVLSPLIAVFCYSVLPVLYAKIGVPANTLSLTVPVVVLSIVLLLIVGAWRKKRKKQSVFLHEEAKSDWVAWGCYIAVAAVVTTCYYLGTLDGPASFPQDSDNTWHLALIKSFVESSNFSMLDATLYHDYQSLQITPIYPSGGSFYPSGWHVLAALCTQVFGISVSLSANAVNTAFLLCVVPSGIWFFFKEVFGNKKILVCLGSLLSLAFVAYPWGMLISISGPLYPNFAGFALVPLVCGLFLSLFKKERKSLRIARIVLLLVGVGAAGCMHANAVFTCAVLLAPYCVYKIISRIWSSSFDKKRKVVFSILGSLAFICIFVAIWNALYHFPLLQGTVSYKWAPYADMRQEFVNILCLAYKMPGTQIVLGCVVFIGVVYTFYQRKYLWISVSYAIACSFCFVSATTNAALKSFLTGFWYTDVYRLGAMAALIAMPLAALGLYVLLRLISSASHYLVQEKKQGSFVKITSVVFLLSFVLVNFYPSFNMPGMGRVTTGFGDYAGCNIGANLINRPNLYDEEEKAFIEEVSELVDPSYAIYNNADDGSPFAYAFEGLNLVYRRSAAQLLDGGETAQSELLRLSIDELADNEDVKQALQDANVRYILVLDLGGEALDERCYYGYYTPSKWPGINNINDETPGLKLLLSEGDMRLYEIE